MTKQTNQIKLPIIATFIQVLLVMKERYRFFISYGIPFFVVQFIAFIFQDSMVSEQTQEPNMAFYILIIFSVFISSMVAVAFHRIFIMDKVDIDKIQIIRFGNREWRFVGWSFLIGLIIFVLYLSLLFLSHDFIIKSSVNSVLILFTATLVPIAYLAARWLLTLPAASVDDENASLSYAWGLSKGNGWRLVFLIFVIPATLNYINDSLLNFQSVVLQVIILLVAMVVTTISIGVISLSYSYLKLNSNPVIEAQNKSN